MARKSGRNVSILIRDTASASFNLSGRSNNVTLNLTSEELDATSFGAANRERIADGLKDWTVDISGFWDGAASQLDERLHGIWSACCAACLGFAGSDTGAVQYSGCAILQNYSIEAAVDGVVGFTCNLLAASDLSRGTY